MAWTINSIRIFVQESKEENGQIIPRLQPLDGETVLQIFGYEGVVHSIGAIIVGDTDRAAIKALPTSGSSYTLVGPEGSMGNFFVKSVAINRVHCICQTLRTDLAEDAPVYEIELQLYTD